MYTVSVLLPAAYLIGLIFTLKTHSHIYDIHISDGHGGHAHGGQYAHEGNEQPTADATTGCHHGANTCINAAMASPGHVAAGVSVVCTWCSLIVRVEEHERSDAGRLLALCMYGKRFPRWGGNVVTVHKQKKKAGWKSEV